MKWLLAFLTAFLWAVYYDEYERPPDVRVPRDREGGLWMD